MIKTLKLNRPSLSGGWGREMSSMIFLVRAYLCYCMPPPEGSRLTKPGSGVGVGSSSPFPLLLPSSSRSNLCNLHLPTPPEERSYAVVEALFY